MHPLNQLMFSFFVLHVILLMEHEVRYFFCCIILGLGYISQFYSMSILDDTEKRNIRSEYLIQLLTNELKIDFNFIKLN